ncbi:Uncharacterised protein [Vibrio cholerae]|uniref:Uncharacterized protein n=1 Tax=Vibrio cholerae TaxID=666 RepID=A0A655PKT8_VIBCL|nr:Uncharacterised protein [Vibrio cholerae]
MVGNTADHINHNVDLARLLLKFTHSLTRLSDNIGHLLDRANHRSIFTSPFL